MLRVDEIARVVERCIVIERRQRSFLYQIHGATQAVAQVDIHLVFHRESPVSEEQGDIGIAVANKVRVHRIKTCHAPQPCFNRIEGVDSFHRHDFAAAPQENLKNAVQI